MRGNEMNIERRAFPVELRVEKRGDKTKIVGHAAIFNSLSVELWGFREEVAPGAFADTIKEDDIRALFNHDPNLILGRNTSGTLALTEDDKGLFYEIDPPDTQTARDLVLSIERGDISQNSFAFNVLPDGAKWREDANGTLIRTIVRAKLYDISPVTYPAYLDTDISLRTAGETLATEGRNIVAALRSTIEPEVNHWEIDVRRRRLDLAARGL